MRNKNDKTTGHELFRKEMDPAKQREIDVRAYGAQSTRRNKRKSQKLYNVVNSAFSELTTSFTNTFVNSGFDMESADVIAKFDINDGIWRMFARYTIKNNLDVFNTTPKRVRFIGKFTDFVNKLVDKTENGKK